VVTTSTTFYHASSEVIDVPCANQDHDHARRANLPLPAQQGDRPAVLHVAAIGVPNLVLFTLLASVCRRGQTTQ